MTLPACASCVEEPQAPSHTPRLLALMLHTPNPSKATSMVRPCSFPPFPRGSWGCACAWQARAVPVPGQGTHVELSLPRAAGLWG